MTLRVLKFKEGVSLAGLQPEALIGIAKCLDVFNQHSLVLILTSCRDGVHGKHSHHFKGLAWDIRVWDIKDRIDEFCDYLREELGADYQVINEVDHIHVEYDPE